MRVIVIAHCLAVAAFLTPTQPLLGAIGGVAAPSIAFSSMSSYALGVNPRTVALGDFDGDGALDLAAADGGIGGAGDLRVLRGTGAGAFTTAGSYFAGRVPVWVVSGDFNGDGALDLAATNSDGGDSTFSIFIGNGDITFRPPASYSIGINPFGMSVDDFDRDGRLDIAVAFQTGDVAILRGNGNGTFAESARYTLGAGPIPTLVSGDLNGDNVPDLVVANRGANEATVFMGNGDATFGPPVSYAVGLLPFAVAIGDLDLDGNADLAVTNAGSGTLSVLLGRGDGSFETQTMYDSGTGPTDTPQGIVAADLDGDGLTDLAVSNFATNSVATLGGNGDGTLQAPVQWTVGVGPYSLGVADVNSDGSPDLAVPNFTSRTVTILLTTASDVTPPVVSCQPADGTWHPTDVSIACTASDSASGLADAGDASFSLATNVAVGVETADASTGSHFVCDNAGNCTEAGPIGGNKIDVRAPVASITAPTTTAYTLQQAVASTYGCSDGGSGVSGCAGPVANGANIDTTSAGTHTFSVTATDAVGNTTSASVTYTVAYGVCVLFDQTKAHKAGSTVPIKLQLCDAAGGNVSSASVPVVATAVYLVSTQAPGFLEDSGSANPDNQFRFSDGSYIFNLSLKGFSQGTYAVVFTAGTDATPHVVQFQVK